LIAAGLSAIPTLWRGVLVAVMLAHPIAYAKLFWDSPIVLQDVRGIGQRLLREVAPGDTVFIYYWAVPTARFYFTDGLRAAGAEVIESAGPRQDVEASFPQLHALAGRERVWVVFGHAKPHEEAMTVAELDALGSRQEHVPLFYAALYRYDLRGPETVRAEGEGDPPDGAG
jgi:hypothetical protein